MNERSYKPTHSSPRHETESSDSRYDRFTLDKRDQMYISDRKLRGGM